MTDNELKDMIVSALKSIAKEDEVLYHEYQVGDLLYTEKDIYPYTIVYACKNGKFIAISQYDGLRYTIHTDGTPELIDTENYKKLLTFGENNEYQTLLGE